MTRPLAQRVRGYLPDGRALPEADWRRRHAVLTWVLALHVPAIFGYGLATGVTWEHATIEATIPLLLLGAALSRLNRRVRAVAVGLGLISCSAIFVHLSDGLIEWHFHYFVSLALVSLYHEWLVYLTALGFVIVQHAVGSVISYDSVYNHGNGELSWTLVHGGFVLAASACHITTWRLQERADAQTAALQREVDEGEQSIRARLEQTAQMRSDLIATASHELRTPLTAISGAADTLLRHDAALAPEDRRALLGSVVERSERLAEMVESMLIASAVEPPAPACTPLAPVVAGILGRCQAAGPVEVDVPGGLAVNCNGVALGQLLERLAGAARREGGVGAPVRLRAERHGPQVRLSATVGAPDQDGATLAALLEPFRGGTGPTARSADVGLNLYAARRIAEVHGGRLGLRHDGVDLVLEAWLPVAELPSTDLPAPRPAPAEDRSRATGVG
jgi:signal transduction histidine kinase